MTDSTELTLMEWIKDNSETLEFDQNMMLHVVEKTIQVKGAGSDLHEWAKRIEVTDDLAAVLDLLDEMLGFARHAEDLIRSTKCMILLEYAVQKARARLDEAKDVDNEDLE